MKSRLLFRLVLLLPVVAILAGTAGLWTTDYELFVGNVASRYVPPDKLARFRETLLTPGRFDVLRIVALAVSLLSVLGAAAFWQKNDKFSGFFRRLTRVVPLTWQRTSRLERRALAVLLVVVAGTRLFFATRLLLHVDERFTYLYFVGKGWLVSATYYPNPNNHILFSLLAGVLGVFFKNPLWVLRTASLLAGLAASAAWWAAARFFLSARVAFVAAALTAFAPPVFNYGIQGRGYGLLLCWTALLAAATVRMAQNRRVAGLPAVVFALSGTLGFYTIPSFVYPFVGATVFLFLSVIQQRNFRQIAKLAVLATFAAIGVLVLYLPVFLANGWGAVTHNDWVAPLPSEKFWAAFRPNLIEGACFLWNDWAAAPWLTLLFSGLAIWASTRRKLFTVAERHWLDLYVCCLWTVVPLLVWQRTPFYSRVLVYALPLQWLAVAVILHKFLPKRRWWPAMALAVVLYAAVCLQTFRWLASPAGRGIYNSLDGVTKWLYQRRADDIYVQYYEYGLCVRFAYETTGRPLRLDVGADRLRAGHPYRFVVVHRSHSLPSLAGKYRVVYQDGEARIYERNDE